MLRSAAKNEFVTVPHRSADYPRFLAECAAHGGDTTPRLPQACARKVFRTTGGTTP